MRYLEFLLGQEVTFAVADKSSPQQVADRLRPEVKSRFWPFHFEQIVGRVRGDKVSLEWRGSLFASNMAPLLRGRLVSAGAATRFEGRFGAPIPLRFFLALWVCFDLMFFVLALNGSLEGGNVSSWLIYPFLLVHLLAPFVISAIGMIGADKIRQRLIDFTVKAASGHS